MPFDSEGIFTRLHNWEEDRINGIEIVTDHHDAEDDNFAAALNETFLRDGRVPMQNHLNMGGFRIQNCGDGKDKGDLVNKKQLDENVAKTDDSFKKTFNSVCCIGDIKASVIDKNHGGWILCNGQALSRTDYADLFKLIGTKFGVGNNSTTFNVPDYRGKFLRGLGGDSASDIYTTQTESVPLLKHRHKLVISGLKTGGDGKFLTNNSDNHSGNSDYVLGFMDSDTEPSLGNTGLPFAESGENRAGAHVTPINQAVYYFIKAKNI